MGDRRYSVSDVRAVFDTFKSLAVRLGMPGAQTWSLREGSAVNGRPYRFYAIGESGGQWDPMAFPNLLGVSAKEAWQTLSAYLTGMRAVVRVLENSGVRVLSADED
ncbi:MAG TPA: hypothetical protein VFQ06_09135 [Nitrospira sp.]|nr:hypothetical protein [Nitrospira sp.]